MDKTSIWSIKKHKWNKGPKLPKEIAYDTQVNIMTLIEAIEVMKNLPMKMIVFVLDAHCYFTRLNLKERGALSKFAF